MTERCRINPRYRRGHLLGYGCETHKVYVEIEVDDPDARIEECLVAKVERLERELEGERERNR